MESREPRERLRRAMVAAYGGGPAQAVAGQAGTGQAGAALSGTTQIGPIPESGPSAGDRFDTLVASRVDGEGTPRETARPRHAARIAGVRVVTAARVAVLVLVVGIFTTAVLAVRPSGPEAAEVPLPVPGATVQDQAGDAPRGDPGAAHPPTGSDTEPAAPTDPIGDADQGDAPPADVVVHVAGAVREPGVVRLPAGARVAEAIDAAGGALADADLDAVNLAAPLTDGAQVYLPTEAEDAPPAGTGAPAPATSGTTEQDGAPLVDLNTADAAALETLPGIGPARAAEIIAWREREGEYSSVDQLLEVSGIGPATLERLRERVRV
ncbi:ComEA family DNA-binding protein [Ruania halotolerans]|uniref:ComEA family DNA-binding protein n=1 Tax=Ruania halotolerans TaxID=2897773 RepID=UPI001E326CAE|nr:ComEA family DNA-binding protein [Ruania halotolerans]UFU04952.1 helix-hairpin-helix domain-containing protein [Ruania halotolerans]